MTQIRLVLLALVLVLVTGCAKLRPAVNVLEGLCTLNLTEHPVVAEVSAERGIPIAELAAILCSIPAIYDAWQAARDEGRSDPASAAIRRAEELGAL